MNNNKLVDTNAILETMSLLSFYAPLIVSISILILSIFSGSIEKGLFFIFWIFIITSIRPFVVNRLFAVNDIFNNSQCYLGQIYETKTSTYSTFVLWFTLFYFICPMIIIGTQSNTNIINYGVLWFFIFYIVFDVYIKNAFKCINSIKTLLIDSLLGSSLGALIAFTCYNSPIKSYLFINELNSNKEVCSMPNKQQFKCSVYKNGEIVSSSVTM